MDRHTNRGGKRNKRLVDFYAAIEGMMVNNKSTFFQVLYQAMMEHPSYIILSDMERERKVDILKQMLKHYENIEDYEKCANLIKLQKSLI